MAAAVDEIRASGNAAFKRRDYAAAVQHYTEALEALSSRATAGAESRLPLLTNRALAAHRLGDYAAAVQDAEAALELAAGNTKAAFRAAAARLALGDGAAAARHAALLQPDGDGAAAAQPAGWVALRQHAEALLAHQQRVAACRAASQQQGDERAVQRAVERLLQVLAAEAAGEEEEEEDGSDVPAGGAAALLERLAGLLSSTGSGSGGASATAAAAPSAAAAAAAALDAAPGERGWRLLLFFLADPDPSCQAGAAAALQAAALAAGGGGSVLWPAHVWDRLAAAANGWSSSAASTASNAVTALRLLAWAAERDAWVRQQLLTNPLPAEGGPVAATGGAARSRPVAQIVGMLGDASQLRGARPAAVAAAAALLRPYGRDPAAAEALRALACRPLLVLLRATAGVDGMAAFAQEEDPEEGADAHAPDGGSAAPVGGAAGSAAASGSSKADPEQQALEALRRKRAAVYIAEAVALRRELLAAACELAGGARELLLDEAVAASGRGGGGGKRGVAAGAFLTDLLGWVRELHSQQPRRTVPVLGPNGAARAYAKRRFAADFKDNPAGDFLLSLDLQDGEDTGGGSAAAGCASSGDSSAPPGSGGSAAAPQPQQQPTQLELSLRLVLHAAAASPAAAALLYRRDLFALCDELCTYCTPAVVTAGQRLFAAVADRVAAAAEEVLQGDQPPSLAALVLHSGSGEHQAAALGKLAAVADTCGGDGFALLCGSLPGQGLSGGGGRAAAEAARAAAVGSAVYRAWQLAGGEQATAQAPGGSSSTALQRAALRFLLRCLERAQRQQGLRPEAAPRGAAWDAIGRAPLQALLLRERQQARQPQQAQHEEEAAGLDKLKRGFFAKPAPRAAGAAKPPLPPRGIAAAAGSRGAAADAAPAAVSSSGTQPTGGSAATSTYKSGTITIEELPAEEEEQPPQQAADRNGDAAAPPPPPGAGQQRAAGPGKAAPAPAAAAAVAQQSTVTAEEWAAAEALSDSGDEEVADLADVYDSSTCLPAEVRRARADWLAAPMEKRLRWIQTSTDVSVSLALPPGTRAADVSVSVGGGRLSIGLRWFGTVLEGALHRPVKASETHWCLEGEELQVLLAKGDASWWKALVEGGEEKSYVDILKEAVNADEPVQPYDEMDDKAKDLLDAIHERQAYINAGLIDPEDFDDFRVVIGENSLKPPGTAGL